MKVKRKILIGICGGIAAYKILECMRLFKKSGYEVKVILTKNAHQFITPLSIAALIENNPITEDNFYDPVSESTMSHINLARWPDVILIAPLSANTLGKIANGICDSLLTNILLATDKPIYIAPAMNTKMYEHKVTIKNLELLIQELGYKQIGPNTGEQACGEFGEGRMSEPNEIFNFITSNLNDLLSNKTILISAGPTIEEIDPVRYISNHSSGKMGYALAKAAESLGAHVTLIHGPTSISPPQSDNIKLIAVKSANQMLQAVESASITSDIFISCAAVCDYSPIKANQKIKKSENTIIIEMSKNTDIVKTIASYPKDKRPYTVAFAAETNDLINNATKKLHDKKVDMIIANKVGNKLVFDQDNISFCIITNSNQQEVELLPKSEAAYLILSKINEQMK